MKSPVSPLLQNLMARNGHIVDDRSWDYVENTAQATRHRLLTFIQTTKAGVELLHNTGRLDNEAIAIKNHVETAIEQASQNWALLYPQSEGKTGPAASPAEAQQIMTLSQQYIEMMESLLSDVQLSVARFGELVMNAEAALAAASQMPAPVQTTL